MKYLNLEDEVSIEEIQQLESQFLTKDDVKKRTYITNKKIRYIDYLVWLELGLHDEKNTFFLKNIIDFKNFKLIENLYKNLKTDDLLNMIARAEYFFDYDKPKKEFIKNDPYFLFLSEGHNFLDCNNVYQSFGTIFNELNNREQMDRLSELNLDKLIGGWQNIDYLESDEQVNCILIDLLINTYQDEKDIENYNSFKEQLLDSLENIYEEVENCKSVKNIVEYFLAIKNVMFGIESKNDLLLLKENNVFNKNIINDKILMSNINLINEKLLKDVKLFIEKNDNVYLRNLINSENDNELKELVKPTFVFSINYLAEAQNQSKIELLSNIKKFENLLRKSIFNDFFVFFKIPDGDFYVVNKKALNSEKTMKDDCHKFLEILFKHPNLISETNLDNLNNIIEKNLQKVMIEGNVVKSLKAKKVKF